MQKLKLVFARLWLLLLCAVGVVIVDQLSKYQIERTLALGESADFLAPYLSWTHAQNTGAAFSMLQNGGWFFFVLGGAASAFVVYYILRLPIPEYALRVALGCVLGGILGNLIDRARQGYVTDFIHFQIPAINFDFAVFNGADSFLFIGVVLLFILNFRQTQ